VRKEWRGGGEACRQKRVFSQTDYSEEGASFGKGKEGSKRELVRELYRKLDWDRKKQGLHTERFGKKANRGISWKMSF